MPDNILKIKNKRLKEEFWNHQKYQQGNSIDPYTGRELQRELPKDPAKDHVVLYLTLPEKNFLKRHKGYIEFSKEPEQKRVNFFKKGSTYFDEDQPLLALGFMLHYPIRDDHGQIIGWTPTTYGQSGQELERETTNMYINEYGDLPWWYEGSYRNSYELPEVIISKKQGGTGQAPYLNDNSHPWWNPFNTLKKRNGGTILQYQDGGNIWSDVAEAGSYMVPIYGTYLSARDAIRDPSWTNWGLAGLSLLGDIATVAGGSGLLVKGASAASKSAKFAKAAKASEKEAEAMIKYAEKLAPLSGKYWTYTEIPSAVTGKTVLKPTAPAKFVKPEQAQAVRRTIDAIYSDAEGVLRKALDLESLSDLYKTAAKYNTKLAGRIAAGGTAVKGGKSVQKATLLDKLRHTTNNQRLNYVQKDTTKPWWNPF